MKIVLKVDTENDYNFKVDIEESWELKIFHQFFILT